MESFITEDSNITNCLRSPVRYNECVRNNLASNVSPTNADKQKL